jgi:thymidylate synthase
MYEYLALGKKILDEGYSHPDRTGVGRQSLFSQCLRIDMRDGFPLVSTRHIDFNAVIEETLWFIRGSNDAKELQAKKVKFWDHWAVKEHHIDSFIKQYILPFFGHQIDEETVHSTCKQRLMEYIGRIGPLYGPAWRKLPVSEMIARLNGFLPALKEDQLASDKKQQWLKRLRERSAFT